MTAAASTILIERIRAKIQAMGLSWAELARRSNRSHTYWLRKLEPASAEGERKLAVQDLDELEAALGLPPGGLLETRSAAAEALLDQLNLGRTVRFEESIQAAAGELLAQGIAVVVRNRVRLAA